MLALTGRIVRDDGLAAAPPQPRPEGITGVGRASQAPRRRQGGDPGRRDGLIALMPSTDEQLAGATSRIDGGMEFGRAPAPRAANGLVERPPFPPAAARCTWTGVESSSSAPGGPPTASSANTWSQTPLRTQRTNRVYSVLDGPEPRAFAPGGSRCGGCGRLAECRRETPIGNSGRRCSNSRRETLGGRPKKGHVDR